MNQQEQLTTQLEALVGSQVSVVNRQGFSISGILRRGISSWPFLVKDMRLPIDMIVKIDGNQITLN